LTKPDKTILFSKLERENMNLSSQSSSRSIKPKP
jgi:hypothetical protein